MNSRLIKHTSCENCGSSDAKAIYSDGHRFCFSCSHYFPPEDDIEEEKLNNLFQTSKVYTENKPRVIQPILVNFEDMEDRGISKATAEKYQVFRSPDSFYSWVYPSFKNGVHVGNKLRQAEKKGFSVEGDVHAELFGQHLFPPGSARTITVCEGRDDAMAAYQMQGSRYPFVSVDNAATARKDCADNYEYLNSFDEIVLCFDKDEPKLLPDGTVRYPGQDAAQAVAAMFPPKKVRILTLSKAKDANEYLKNGWAREFEKEWWNAPTWTPQGIVLGTDLWDEISKEDTTESVSYPFSGLNELTYGLRLSELVIVTADTGVGKTQILREITHHLLNNTPHAIGMMFLEEPMKDTGLGIMSVEANKPLHLPDVRASISKEELRKYYDKTVNSDRIILYDHFGSNEISDLLAKIRHMAAMGAKYIILDHLSIVVSDQSGDERKQLDEISTKIKQLTIELNICVIAVIHQNRQGQIRGTAGVEQLANIVIKLYRDKESEDPFRRNVTKVSVQKNRFCGRTGPACYLFYDSESGRLSELDKTAIEQYESGEEVSNKNLFKDEW